MRDIRGTPFSRATHEALLRHQRSFERVVDLGEARAAAGQLDAAAVYAQAAAEYAWRNHPGQFTSDRLERLVSTLAPPWDPAPRSEAGAAREAPERVLHVLSQAYEAFGHTRLCWRWMKADNGRVHSAVLTNQAGLPIPPALAEALPNRGPSLVDLTSVASLRERARTLRAISSEHDYVVLYVHPYDVVSTMAFSTPLEGVPVLLVNHSDHVFWLGVNSCDAVACIRATSKRISAERRGIPRDRLVLVPLPLPPVTTASRERARRELGVTPDELLMVSIGSAYKYESQQGPLMTDLVVPILREHPQARLIAVGPTSEGVWKRAEEATRGRLSAAGSRDSVDVFYHAADIYLDSFPLSSLTALLEAGQHGLPLVRLAPDAEWQRALVQPDDPALDALELCEDGNAYRHRIVTLLKSPQQRIRDGTAARTRIEQIHCTPGWLSYVDQAYETVLEAAGSGRSPEVRVAVDPDDSDLGLTEIHARGDVEAAYFRLMWAHVQLLSSLRSRILMTVRFCWALRSDLAALRPARIGRAIRRNARRRRRSLMPRLRTRYSPDAQGRGG
jgi:hypothetical protein